MRIAAGDIRLVIMTSRRSPDYFHTTLASLFLSDPLVHQLKGLHLVVGSPDANYLRWYRHHSRVHIHPLPEELADANIAQRAIETFHSALTMPPEDYRGLCVCEGDIVFHDGFLSTLIDAVNQVEGLNLERYLLDCYLPPGVRAARPAAPGASWTQLEPPSFYGNQCIYYPARVVPEFARFIQRYGIGADRPLNPDDYVLQYALWTNCLYGATRSLVQHIGFHSTGLASFFHQAATFDDRVPGLEPNPERWDNRPKAIHFDLRQSLGDGAKILGWLAASQDSELICDIAADVPGLVAGDYHLLRISLARLLGDTIVTVSGGAVTLRVRCASRNGDRVMLHFAIAASPHRITPEQRTLVDSLTSTVKEKIETMGGRFWTGESSHQGLAIHFTAPFRVAESAQSKFAAIEGLAGRRVLVADRNPVSREVLVDLLTAFGAQTCSDPQSAWLAIVDDFELAEKIKTDVPHILMLLTARVDDDTRARFRTAGVADFIHKPILQSELREALLYFLDLPVSLTSRDREGAVGTVIS